MRRRFVTMYLGHLVHVSPLDPVRRDFAIDTSIVPPKGDNLYESREDRVTVIR